VAPPLAAMDGRYIQIAEVYLCLLPRLTFELVTPSMLIPNFLHTTSGLPPQEIGDHSFGEINSSVHFKIYLSVPETDEYRLYSSVWTWRR
jgi:hypothetical protein